MSVLQTRPYEHTDVLLPHTPPCLTSASVDSGGAEGLPDDGFTDVGGDEQGDARAQTIALLQQLIQQQHDQTRHKQLEKKRRVQGHADNNTAILGLKNEVKCKGQGCADRGWWGSPG